MNLLFERVRSQIPIIIPGQMIVSVPRRKQLLVSESIHVAGVNRKHNPGGSMLARIKDFRNVVKKVHMHVF